MLSIREILIDGVLYFNNKKMSSRELTYSGSQYTMYWGYELSHTLECGENVYHYVVELFLN
jgi:hypothetical protein